MNDDDVVIALTPEYLEALGYEFARRYETAFLEQLERNTNMADDKFEAFVDAVQAAVDELQVAIDALPRPDNTLPGEEQESFFRKLAERLLEIKGNLIEAIANLPRPDNALPGAAKPKR